MNIVYRRKIKNRKKKNTEDFIAAHLTNNILDISKPFEQIWYDGLL